jgi:hypothetical protein
VNLELRGPIPHVEAADTDSVVNGYPRVLMRLDLR